MDKEQFINTAFEKIRAKNLSTPFEITEGSVVPNLEKYLNSLKAAYLNAQDPRIIKLFQDKIEVLMAL
ncbi:MAG: hypothetical protein LBE34_00930 [Flavobacteriaceae bacterium]|jgi:uncharacterized protein YydD (DUF2326 family)|nr:hypothetical protein [Flavobacteriaceae bacterium]